MSVSTFEKCVQRLQVWDSIRQVRPVLSGLWYETCRKRCHSQLNFLSSTEQEEKVFSVIFHQLLRNPSPWSILSSHPHCDDGMCLIHTVELIATEDSWMIIIRGRNRSAFIDIVLSFGIWNHGRENNEDSGRPSFLRCTLGRDFIHDHPFFSLADYSVSHPIRRQVPSFTRHTASFCVSETTHSK
jgi:hypothetical protein